MKHSMQARNTILLENQPTDTLAASSPNPSSSKQPTGRKQKLSEASASSVDLNALRDSSQPLSAAGKSKKNPPKLKRSVDAVRDDRGVPGSSDSGVKGHETQSCWRISRRTRRLRWQLLHRTLNSQSKRSGRKQKLSEESAPSVDLNAVPDSSQPLSAAGKSKKNPPKPKLSVDAVRDDGGVPDYSDSGVKKLCIDPKMPQQCSLHEMKLIAGYCSHPQHKLVRAEKDALLETCKVCKARIFGLGSCYKCNDCCEYLHEACLNAKPNSTKPYPFSPYFTLEFSTEEVKKLHCTACCSHIEGIMYTGSHANKKYSLHPQCLELSNLVRAGFYFECNGMNSELELMERFPEMSTDMKCLQCKTKDGEGWCYGIKSNGEFKLACHVRCLKERLGDDYHRTIIPVKMADGKQYFKILDHSDLVTRTSSLGSEVVS